MREVNHWLTQPIWMPFWVVLLAFLVLIPIVLFSMYCIADIFIQQWRSRKPSHHVDQIVRRRSRQE